MLQFSKWKESVWNYTPSSFPKQKPHTILFIFDHTAPPSAHTIRCERFFHTFFPIWLLFHSGRSPPPAI